MDMRSLLLILSAATLALTGLIYGIKFIRKGNYLIGFEWLILGVSSSNATLFFFTNWPTSYAIAHFFDSFSRAFGIPIVTTAGLMILTHGYRPTIRQDVLYFVLSFAAAAILVFVPAVAPILPWFYVVMWTGFSLFLAYFIKRLWMARETGHALLTTVALISCQAIASIYDFYKIPGEETNVVFNFFTLALFTWAFLTVELYYAYGALERALAEKGRRP